MSDHVWHYTTSLWIGDILRAGLITCSQPCYLHPLPTVFCTTKPWFVGYGGLTAEERLIATTPALRSDPPPTRTLGGYLQLAATEGVDVALRQAEKDAVKAAVDRRSKREPSSVTTYRVEVRPEAAPLDWDAYLAAGGSTAFGRYAIPLYPGTFVESWRMSLRPIRRRLWLAVERCEDPSATLCVEPPSVSWETLDSDALRSLASAAPELHRQFARSRSLTRQVLNSLPNDVDFVTRAVKLAQARKSEVSAERLLELEPVIERGPWDSLAAGCALAEIKDRGLWRPFYTSWALYCWVRWHRTPVTVRRCIEAAAETRGEASEDGR